MNTNIDNNNLTISFHLIYIRERRSRDRSVDGFTTTCESSDYRQ